MMLHNAIKSLYPNEEWEIIGDDYSTLKWKSDLPKPTESEIQAEIVRLQAEYEANEYQRQRATAYPSIQEQLDMQYWDSVNGTTTWADAIAAVKQEFPKP